MTQQGDSWSTEFGTTTNSLRTGFTVDVDCQFQDLSNTTTPAVARTQDKIQGWDGDVDIEILKYTGMLSGCSAPDGRKRRDTTRDQEFNTYFIAVNYSYTFSDASQSDTVLMSVCETGTNYSTFFPHADK